MLFNLMCFLPFGFAVFLVVSCLEFVTSGFLLLLLFGVLFMWVSFVYGRFIVDSEMGLLRLGNFPICLFDLNLKFDSIPVYIRQNGKVAPQAAQLKLFVIRWEPRVFESISIAIHRYSEPRWWPIQLHLSLSYCKRSFGREREIERTKNWKWFEMSGKYRNNFDWYSVICHSLCDALMEIDRPFGRVTLEFLCESFFQFNIFSVD